MADENVPCRVFVILAREARVAAVFRRGPSKACRLLRWALDKDAFEPGQWIRGRVYERRCDLSPDGKYLIYFAQNFARPERTGGSWTAISKLPWWTALALWKKGDCWHGGGFFVDDRTVYVRQPTEDTKILDVGRSFERRFRLAPKFPYAFSVGNSECLGIYYPRLVRDGWRYVGGTSRDGADIATFEKASPKRPDAVLVKHAYAGLAPPDPGLGCYFDRHLLRLSGAGGEIDLATTEWADWDRDGTLLTSREGRLFRHMLSDHGTDERELIDLNPMTFDPEPSPPEARRW